MGNLDLTTIGLLIIIFGLGGAWVAGVMRKSHNQTIIPFESLYDCERLEQLVRISGGGSLAQIIRLYKIRGKEMSKIRSTGEGFYVYRNLLRDRILLSQEINRLITVEAKKESSLLLVTH